jgi:hypothetical protein
MAYTHSTITLTGAAQQLIANITPAQNIPIREISFQEDGSNGAAVFIGSSSGVTTADYGIRIPVPVTNVPAAPVRLGPYATSGPIKLGDFWVIGTAAQKLHVSYVPF